ncbi:MAG: zf-HC2 domain-containing protein [Planctomycetes bacterium]|nr:zf-HC2 domain-containing protein [Planctomycetota bacterium]
MKCEFDRELLDAYVDGELGSEEAALVEKHIAACRECGDEVEMLRNLSSSVRDAGSRKAPPGAVAAIRERVGGGRVSGGGVRFIYTAFAAAAALIVVTAVSMRGFREAERQEMDRISRISTPALRDEPAAGEVLKAEGGPAAPADAVPVVTMQSPAAPDVEESRTYSAAREENVPGAEAGLGVPAAAPAAPPAPSPMARADAAFEPETAPTFDRGGAAISGAPVLREMPGPAPARRAVGQGAEGELEARNGGALYNEPKKTAADISLPKSAGGAVPAETFGRARTERVRTLGGFSPAGADAAAHTAAKPGRRGDIASVPPVSDYLVFEAVSVEAAGELVRNKAGSLGGDVLRVGAFEDFAGAINLLRKGALLRSGAGPAEKAMAQEGTRTLLVALVGVRSGAGTAQTGVGGGAAGSGAEGAAMKAAAGGDAGEFYRYVLIEVVQTTSPGPAVEAGEAE